MAGLECALGSHEKLGKVRVRADEIQVLLTSLKKRSKVASR
jgi:hypothetical protein